MASYTLTISGGAILGGGLMIVPAEFVGVVAGGSTNVLASRIALPATTITLPTITLIAAGYYFSASAEITIPTMTLVFSNQISLGVSITLPVLEFSATSDGSVSNPLGQVVIQLPTPLIAALAAGKLLLPEGAAVSNLALCLNIENGSLSQYLNYGFNSFAIINGVVCGASETALFELSGEDDNGSLISSVFRIARNNFGTDFLKRAWNAYVSHKNEGKCQVKLVDNKDHTSDGITLLRDTSDVAAQRVKLNHRIKSNYFGIEYSNTDGADFEVEEIELTAEVTNRRQ